MDDTIYKIAIAGFLHDIGKFAERADMPVSKEYLNNNAGLYQPYYKTQNRYTHKHAVYTAAFIEENEKYLPPQFNKANWGLGDSFINLAAMHHKPESPLQWIIAIADRVSSGFDRQKFEDYNLEIKVKDYTKTRLIPLLEGISLEENSRDDSLDAYKFRYQLKELTPDSIFPSDLSEYRILNRDDAKREYSTLFNEFVNALERLWHKENIPLWFEHFENLFMIYASHIPSATVGLVVPDISLFDHAKTTASFASALYVYHSANGSLDKVDSIKSYDDKKFLLVNGDFYGIQDFIFTSGGSTGRASAKLLRGRSFSVSLITELAADMLCREIGLPSSSIILNAAGKFTLISPNTKAAKEAIQKASITMNEWLINNFYGQSSIGISYVEASCNDFVTGNFPSLWEKLQTTIDRKKYTKFNISESGGSVTGYLNSFNNKLIHPMCPFCGKRPSHDDAFVRIAGHEKESACKICRDHIYMGEHLVKNEKIAIATSGADIRGEKLLEPIFGTYQISFDVEGKLGGMSKSGDLLKYWDISIKKDGRLSKEIATKFINGYVPKYTDEDNYDDRLLAGKKRNETKLELVESIKEGSPKTFLHIAKKSLHYTDKPDKFRGIESLCVLKADVDNLGLIFSFGIRNERQTLSRIATLSRQLNNFFTVYVPYLLSTDDRFKDIYTVFAGGDDLFLIGPWNRIIEFSAVLKEKFEKYVCKNKDVTLSAGISIHKPSEPVMMLSENAENALRESKASGKNRITIFHETATWDEFDNLMKIKENIEHWFDNGVINNAMLFRLNELIGMAKQEKEIQRAKYSIHIEDMECLKWRARLKYSVVRNIGKRLKNEQKERAIEEVLTTMKWLDEYAGGMKIPLWQILYNNR